jgi:solute carrier family 13 (sodium-dependent dicarboxylate transporter), member 2/3/5
MAQIAHSIDASPSNIVRPTTSARCAWLKPALIAIATFAACAGIWATDTMPQPAKLSLMVFLVAIAAWVGTRLPETAVALVAASALVLFDAIQAEHLFSGLGDDMIWLLIGAFLMAAVVRSSGLAQRFVLRAVAGSASVRGLFHRLTWLMIATAFVIPSTSGRAALLLPVYAVLVAQMPDPGLRRALSLLFPSVILLSACASLLGAGAHLIAVDFMAEMGLRELTFLDWALIGTPFAILTSLIAAEIILHLFVDADVRNRPMTLPEAPRTPFAAVEYRILAMVALTIALWATTAWHGLDPALISILGAVAMANRTVGGVSLKDAIKNVEWNLILFLAATLVLGEALLDSGAADWLARGMLRHLPMALLLDPVAVIAIAASIAMVSHLLITSRSARAAVLIPTLALPLAIAPSQASLLIVIATIGSGFCQTLRVSAKPVTLYSEHDGVPAYTDADLMRLALWLMPPFALLLFLFAMQVWPRLGLGMSAY